MKNFILSVIIIAFVSAVLQVFLPWYIIALAAFVTGYAVKQSAFSVLVAGFLAVFLLWIAYAFILSHANNDLLARKVAGLLPLGGNVSLLLIITGVIGGLVSGFAALSGKFAAAL